MPHCRVGGNNRLIEMERLVGQRVVSLRAVSRVVENHRVAAARLVEQVFFHGLQNAVAGGLFFFNDVNIIFREAVLGAGQKLMHGFHVIQGAVEIFPFPQIPPPGIRSIAFLSHSRRFADLFSLRFVRVDSDQQGALGLGMHR